MPLLHRTATTLNRLSDYCRVHPRPRSCRQTLNVGASSRPEHLLVGQLVTHPELFAINAVQFVAQILFLFVVL